MNRYLKGLCGIAAACLFWQAVCELGQINRALFPSPLDALHALWEMTINGNLWRDVRASLLRFAAGFALAVVSGTALGLFFGWFRGLWDYVNPLAQLARPVSPLAWMPFIVLWLGIGDIPAVAVIFIAAFFPVLLSTIKAVREVNPLFINVARNFGFSRVALVREIVVPAIVPRLVTGWHLAMGSAWVFLVVGEMVGAQSGLGFLIIDARNTMRADMLLAAIVVIGALGLGMDWGLSQLERRVLPTFEQRRGRRA